MPDGYGRPHARQRCLRHSGENLSAEDAATLQGALRTEGIETEIAEERQLPAIPATKFVKRLDCLPDALVIYDPLGRRFPLEWRHIMIIAAGNVRRNDFKRIQKKRQVTRYTTDGMAYPDTEVETRTREELNYHLMLEIVLTRAVTRYSVAADEFNFVCLGERMTKSVAGNFSLLVQDLAKSAPHVVLNRGARNLREGSKEVFSYPSRNAFFEEITWLLWRLNQAGTAKSST
jgi:hypothetical protein